MIERLHGLKDDRGAGCNGISIGPFFRRVSFSRSARHEYQGRAANAAHEGGIMPGTTRQVSLSEGEIARSLTQ